MPIRRQTDRLSTSPRRSGTGFGSSSWLNVKAMAVAVSWRSVPAIGAGALIKRVDEAGSPAKRAATTEPTALHRDPATAAKQGSTAIPISPWPADLR